MCMSIGTTIGLAQKSMTWQTVTGCVSNKEWANCCISRVYQKVKIQAHPIYAKLVLENLSAELDDIQTWKN